MSRSTLRLAILAMAMLPACESPGVVTQTEWTLRIPGKPATTIRLPVHIDDALPENCVYTLSSSIPIPAAWQGSDLFLEWPFFQGRTRAFVDNRPLTAISTEFVDGHRRRGPQSWLIAGSYTSQDILLVTFRVEYTWAPASRLDTIPQITPKKSRSAAVITLVNEHTSAIGAVSITGAGFMFLMIFFKGRRRKTFLWFGLQSVAIAYYPLFILGVTQAWGGFLDTTFMGIVVVASNVFAIYCTHAQFQLGLPHRIWPLTFVICCLLGIASADPFLSTYVVVRFTVICATSGVVYQLIILGRQLRRRPQPVGSTLLFFCWLFLGICSAPDLAAWFGFGELAGGIRPVGLGLSIFALLQSLILGRQHIHSLEHADGLNLELAERVSQLERHQEKVESLNVELRRQIADRSSQLVAALTMTQREGGVALEPKAGDLIQDRYRVERKIGAGGMGSVYEVLRLIDQQKFALKLTQTLDTKTLARMAREAHIASKIQHPNVVSIVDIDFTEGGFMYLVLEYVQGDTLRQMTGHYGDADWAVEILRQLTAGLAQLHQAGVIHRDLKPTNILISSDDGGRLVVKITDFGISKIQADTANSALQTGSLPDMANESPWLDTAPSGEVSNLSIDQSNPPAPTLQIEVFPPRPAEKTGSQPSSCSLAPMGGTNKTEPELTRIGVVLGTIRYMAPELAITQGAASQASDMFGLGIIAFEILTRKRPFKKAAFEQAAMGEKIGKPPPLAKMVPDLDRSVAAILDACLSFSSQSRPTAKEVCEVLTLAQKKPSGP